jgi:hypothetical protein
MANGKIQQTWLEARTPSLARSPHQCVGLAGIPSRNLSPYCSHYPIPLLLPNPPYPLLQVFPAMSKQHSHLLQIFNNTVECFDRIWDVVQNVWNGITSSMVSQIFVLAFRIMQKIIDEDGNNAWLCHGTWNSTLLRTAWFRWHVWWHYTLSSCTLHYYHYWIEWNDNRLLNIPFPSTYYELSTVRLVMPLLYPHVYLHCTFVVL